MRLLRWLQDHTAEMAFIVAGFAALYAGVDIILKVSIPPILATIMTTFGGIAVAQAGAKKRKDDGNDASAAQITPKVKPKYKRRPRRKRPRARKSNETP